MITSSKRFNVVACGRRWGKTVLGENRLIEPALNGYPVGWFSPTYKMLAEVWRDVILTLKPVLRRSDAQEHRMELLSGGVVDMWSLDNPDIARGRKYRRIVVDEAATVKNLGDAWSAVLRPTLADLEGDAWFLSTPKGRNAFWFMWQNGQNKDDTHWASWQMPTSANPFIKMSEVESMRDLLPERIYSQEVLAQFLDDAGGVFRGVLDAATAKRQEKAVSGHQYVFGVDWGRQNDYTVFAVVDIQTRELVDMDRSNKVEYTTQRGRLKALCERFKPVSVIAESNAMGEPIIEQLRREGIPVRPFLTTNATKAEVVDQLALAFERKDIRVLNEPILINELQAFEMERLPSGLIRYGAPEGIHDDTVIALALAWHGAANRRIPFALRYNDLEAN